MSNMKFLDPRRKSFFTPKCDMNLPENERAVFTVKAMTIGMEHIVKDAAFIRGGDTGLELVYSALNQSYWAIQVGLESLAMGGVSVDIPREDAICHFGFQKIKDSFLETIPAHIRLELSEHIRAQFDLSETDRKN